ncbi:hypothetical protein A3D62_02655 [Candidatus Kaiserbacteria bacterium RIFCSPHIGHO2_02_FULL_49_11]|uniref:Uncharacterized protein n=1 Tax=Candidatus Kaiserbacteria bacterium RIFCSPHIGHO2_02_FULL_49_11 TaxID=1798489 RepID=A0A1F6D2B7_9BACT|nr:MAG: hypothetical protein A3D62_02655 [Candidatus Kaiserbacteria bacterium RIFCSPHIGHO2_02_FULL_49_11]
MITAVKNSRVLHITLVALFCALLLVPIVAFAQQKGYVPLAPLPGVSNTTNLSDFLNAAFKLGLAVAGTLAVVMITIGGIEYMTLESISGKSDAKNKIWNAVIGLLIALLIWIILYTINPNLIRFDFGRNLGSSGGGRSTPTLQSGGGSSSSGGESTVSTKGGEGLNQNQSTYIQGIETANYDAEGKITDFNPEKINEGLGNTGDTGSPNKGENGKVIGPFDPGYIPPPVN